jgi:glutamine amidotransferase-like uncharacterized protein
MNRRYLSGLLAAFVLVSAACGPAPGPHPLVLLYEGKGASANDVKEWKVLLDAKGVSYSARGTAEFNAMTMRDFMGFKMVMIPGGNFEEMGKALTPATTTAIRTAVENGTNYLGVCAGALLAGNSPYNGINLTSGVHFKFHALSAEGKRKAAVGVTFPGHLGAGMYYWEDGPELSGWGKPIAQYYDGVPAVVQGSVGRGWVMLSGVHPEAPANWFEGLEFQPDVVANREFARTLFNAALDGTAQMEF